MTEAIDWVLVEGAGASRLGAIGFLGDRLAVIALFGADDSAEAVLEAARKRPEVLRRDGAIGQLSRRISGEFARPTAPGDIWWQHLQSAPRMRAPRGPALIRAGEVMRVMTRLGSEAALREALKAT